MNHEPYQVPKRFNPPSIPPDIQKQLKALIEPHLFLYRSLPFIGPNLDLEALTPTGLEAITTWLDHLQVYESRRSCASFVEYAFASEKDGSRLTNGEHHNEWHEFFDANPRAVLFAPVEHAKTSHIAVGRVIWSLGKNRNRRLAVISNSGDSAEKILSAIKLHIESNPRIRRVFPHLKPAQDKSLPWNQHAITIERTTIAKDPSVQALGVGGSIVGSRLDGIVLDDVLDFENTRTDEQMQKMLAWYETTVMTRATDGAWIHVIGTPWHPRDLLHELERRPAFVSKRYSAVLNPQEPKDTWIPLWKEQFSTQRLIDIYNETTPNNFARKYLCQAIAVESQRFRQEWIDAAVNEGRLFKRFPLGPLRTQSGGPLKHFTGVDLGMGKTDSDLSVIFTIAIDARGRRIVVDIQSGRWQAPDLLAKIKAAHDLYQSQVLIEDNGAQAFLLQWAADLGVPAKPFTTTSKNKYDEHFGVESLAVEVRNGDWVFPSGYDGPIAQELHALFGEMLTYSPQGHTGDRLMAMWFAREGARHYGMGIQRHMVTMNR